MRRRVRQPEPSAGVVIEEPVGAELRRVGRHCLFSDTPFSQSASTQEGVMPPRKIAKIKWTELESILDRRIIDLLPDHRRPPG